MHFRGASGGRKNDVARRFILLLRQHDYAGLLQPLVVGSGRRQAGSLEGCQSLWANETHVDERFAAVLDAHLIHEEDLAAQMLLEGCRLAGRRNEQQLVGPAKHGKYVHDARRRAGKHRHGRVAGTQDCDVVGGHALQKVGSVGIKQRQHVCRGTAQHPRAVYHCVNLFQHGQSFVSVQRAMVGPL